MSDIFREVDEEIRKEHYEALWKKYGSWLIAAAVALVLAVAGYQGWTAWQRDQAMQASQEYAAAVAKAGDDPAAALQALGGLAKPGSDGYGLLAAFRQAALQAEEGNVDSAVATWEKIAASDAPPKPFRTLATLFTVMHRIDTGDPGALSERLEPIAQSNDPFRSTALELQGLLAQKQGDEARAIELYKQVADGADVPPAQRRRVTQLLAVLEG
ncbi:tetratricopeptide repeat protein [Ferruginivarius sediminum]|uniref:Ancillary SecYEG translocon subunit n=1 Tax=Ferruginivarius sediminum TaxID=2661937 RepID=A0A369TB02_9PROT|nr:tetratricopeptide repeat protein [Ferruginivarius sediminum]RDD62489.1 hypothetical protein DRB17_07540 [Ferruginivarius sediminum]